MERQPQDQETENLLYKLLDVKPDATPEEIRKKYKVYTRRYHPDRNPDDKDAKSKFQELNTAYKILIDPRKRKVYDATGEVDGEGIRDISKFIDAYIYYREKFKEITPLDIETFQKTYVGGEEEEEDLCDFFELNRGDITLILEAIPFSTNEDKKRFVSYFDSKLKEGVFPSSYRATFDKTKKKIKNIHQDLTEEQANDEMASLVDAIRNKSRGAGSDMMSGLMAKYGGGDLKPLEYGEPDWDAIERERAAAKKGKKRGKKVAGGKSKVKAGAKPKKKVKIE